MNMLDSTLSLKEIEHTLAETIAKRKGKARTIGDLQLTNEDYKILSLRFRSYPKYQGDVNIYEQFSLSLITCASYLFIREEDPLVVAKEIYETSSKIPQYLQRKILEEFDFTIKENSLSNPSIHLKTLPQLVSLLLYYSRNSDDIYEKYFSEINECSDGNYTTEFFERIDQKIFTKEYAIYEKQKWQHGLNMQRAAFLDCLRNNYSVEEMLERYPRLSYLYLRNCCKYCESQGKQANLKVVK